MTLNNTPPGMDPRYLYPGRATRVYKCKHCGAPVSFSMRLCVPTGQVQLSGRCEQGHDFHQSWALGQKPASVPFSDGIDFRPIPLDPNGPGSTSPP